MIINEVEVTEVVGSTQKRKRWTAYEKQQIVNETYHPGVSVSFIARRHGVLPFIYIPIYKNCSF